MFVNCNIRIYGYIVQMSFYHPYLTDYFSRKRGIFSEMNWAGMAYADAVHKGGIGIFYDATFKTSWSE